MRYQAKDKIKFDLMPLLTRRDTYGLTLEEQVFLEVAAESVKRCHHARATLYKGKVLMTDQDKYFWYTCLDCNKVFLASNGDYVDSGETIETMVYMKNENT